MCFDWSFVATDIDKESVEWANKMVQQNELKEKIEIRLQSNKDNIFKEIFSNEESFDFCMCNPPFFEDISESNQNNKTLNSGTSNEMVLTVFIFLMFKFFFLN